MEYIKDLPGWVQIVIGLATVLGVLLGTKEVFQLWAKSHIEKRKFDAEGKSAEIKVDFEEAHFHLQASRELVTLSKELLADAKRDKLEAIEEKKQALDELEKSQFVVKTLRLEGADLEVEMTKQKNAIKRLEDAAMRYEERERLCAKMEEELRKLQLAKGGKHAG